LRPTLNGDEVYYALTEGAQKGDATNLGSLSEPRRKQNLYANPKRTAKSICLLFQTHQQKKSSKKLQNVFAFFPVSAIAIFLKKD